MAASRHYLIPVTIALFGLVILAGVATAQQNANYNDGTEDILDMLDRLKQLLLDVLLRVGMVVLLFGVLVWLSAKNSAERAMTGRWLTMGGVGMMVISLAFKAVTALISWVATGG